jgi:hypothetical protein
MKVRYGALAYGKRALEIKLTVPERSSNTEENRKLPRSVQENPHEEEVPARLPVGVSIVRSVV